MFKNIYYYLRHKQGKLSLEYLVVIILVLGLMLVMIFFGGKIKTKIVEGLSEFFDNVLRRG